jgi:hypothetical protein
VIVTGGTDAYGATYRPKVATELYDPGTGTWTKAADPVASVLDAALVPLPDGSILLIGGSEQPTREEYHPLTLLQRYDPATGTWSLAPPMANPRFAHTATVLDDGTVLIVGGCAAEAGPATPSAEVFDPGD